jgi:hypothetical protein
MRRTIFGLSVALVMTVQAAFAAAPAETKIPGGGLFLTGQELAEFCDGKVGGLEDNFNGGTCLGIINGVAEMAMLSKAVCYNNVTRGQITDVVVKFMNAHPDEVPRHTAVELIGMALKPTFPYSRACVAATR